MKFVQKKAFVSGVILFSFQTGVSWADIKEYRYQHLIQNRSIGTHTSRFRVPLGGTFDQKLDPSNPEDSRTFKQRYFINSDYAEGASSPVLYVLCGEGSCDEGGFYGAVLKHAQKYKARLVALEHRFYGTSQPFEELTPENLAYLKTEYALADLARFQDFITAQNKWTGHWIAIGGSYSGSLAAYYRLIYPDKVVGSLASSAPAQAKANFEEYDADVTETAGPECANAIRGVVKQVQDSFSDSEKLAKMKKLFGGESIRNNIDFIYTIADMAAIAIQYGKQEQFCSSVLGSNPLDGYARAGKAMLDWFGITALQDSFQGSESTHAKDYTQGVGSRQWLWQTCTEYGYFQVANSDPTKSVRSPLITLDFHNQMCSEIFGIKEPVNPERINRRYYQPLLDSQNQPSASHIFFTNGSTDPWQFLSISHERGNDTNPLLDYRTIQGGSHCSDLGSSKTTNVLEAQKQFEDLLGRWL